MDLSQAVSLTAVLFTLVFAWPQVFRALRHGVDGISAGAIVQSLVSASMWFGYGMARRLPEVMMADVGVISGQLLVLVLLTRAAVVPVWRATAVVAAAAGAVALAQVPSFTTAVVIVAGLMGLSSAFTQLLEVVREPHKLEGLSGGSYLILTVLAAAWLGYGQMHDDWLIIGPNIVMVPMAGYIAFAAWRAHMGDAAILPDPAPELAAQPEW